MTAMTQSDFAKWLGVAKSYVTALKKAGRLVITGEGLVDAEASKARIAETADPNRDDVKARHAAARGDAAPEAKKTEKGHDFHKARAQKEHYLAEQARLQFEREIGKMIEKAEVSAAIEDVVSVLRQALENLPHRTGPELVGKDLDAIRATLKQEIHSALSEMEREFTRRMAQVGAPE
ncbi:MAG: hypothetical protein BWY57_03061 [Betaproteobacteria bacterium ADurb.Bin341]|nr:MAG: hypothetical protein BWY57_03061 [Betaproteobacteria bacterium ADurb.Bin341]